MELNKKRILRVRGYGQVSLPPDCIEISINLETLDSSYDKMMEKANEALENIRVSLKEEGFNKKDIKTTSFYIDSRYENIKDEDGEYRREFVGYMASNHLKIELEQNPVKLGRILNILAASPVNPELYIRYKLKDSREIKNKLLENAIGDAKEKAELIARAAGVKLMEVTNIDYRSEEKELYNDNIRHSKSMVLSESSFMDLETEDLHDQDTVTIEWEIE